MDTNKFLLILAYPVATSNSQEHPPLKSAAHYALIKHGKFGKLSTRFNWKAFEHIWFGNYLVYVTVALHECTPGTENIYYQID